MLASRPYGSLKSFLRNAKSTLQSAIISQQRVTIVLGNDAADLDSITSSTLFAYLKSSSSSETPLTNTSVNRHLPTYQYPPLYIPVVNSTATRLRERQEITKVLGHENLKLEDLITLDDLETEPPAGLNPDNTSKLSPQYTRIILTGQSTLAGQLSPAFDACVVGHIDNTHDESIPSSPKINEPRISAKAACCTSLIVNRYQMLWNRLSWASNENQPPNSDGYAPPTHDDSTMQTAWDRQIAELAAASILLATDNLEDREVTTEADITAFNYLEDKLLNLESIWNRNEFFKSIT